MNIYICHTQTLKTTKKSQQRARFDTYRIRRYSYAPFTKFAYWHICLAHNWRALFNIITLDPRTVDIWIKFDNEKNVRTWSENMEAANVGQDLMDGMSEHLIMPCTCINPTTCICRQRYIEVSPETRYNKKHTWRALLKYIQIVNDPLLATLINLVRIDLNISCVITLDDDW